MINLLVEVSPVDATGALKTFHLASAGVGRKGLQFGDGNHWLPLITKQPAREISWASEGELQETSIEWESLSFNMAPPFGNDEWPNLYNWQGAPCRMWRGNLGDPFSAYVKIYEGTCGAIGRKGLQGELPLLGTDFALDRNILTATYAGTGGAEGPSDLRTLKPFAAGVCINVEPVKIDPVNLVFQYHGYGATKAVDEVYENTVPLGSPIATVSSYAALLAVSLKSGEWAAAPAVGMFRLANSPSGKLTADVRGALASDGTFPTTVGGVMTLLISRTGFAGSSVAASLANRPESCPLYITEQTTVQEELRKALLACGCASVPTAGGQFAALDYYDLNTPIVLDAGQGGPLIVESYSQLPVAPPVYRVTVSGERNWSVHSEQEISPLFVTLSSDLEAKDEAIREAKAAADQAQADSDVQKLRIDDILSDGLLTRNEKAPQIARYNSESAQFNELYTKASTFDVSTERAALNTTWNALTAYLNGLVPAFTDLNQSTPIDSQYETRWKDYELAKVTLLRAMSGDARVNAVWGNVSGPGKPEDGATRNVLRGPWANGVQYYVGDIVFYGGSSYGVTTAHVATAPPPGAYYMTFASQGATGESGGAGEQGNSLYTWIAYANSADGSQGFTNGANTGQTYIGIANNRSASTESSNPADYTWSLIKGTDGVRGDVGPKGDPTYTWFAYSSAIDGSLNFTTGNASAIHSYVGIAANKPTQSESSNPADYTWSKMQGDKGDPGPKGDSAIVAYLTNETVNIPCDYNGAPLSYASATGQMRVFLGTNEITSACVFTEVNNTNASVSPNFNGNSNGFYELDALVADTGTVLLRATYSGVSIDKVFTATKSKAGAPGGNGAPGAAAKNVTIVANNLVLRLDKNGEIAAGHPNFVFSVQKQNTSAAAVFTNDPGHQIDGLPGASTITNEVLTVSPQRMLDEINYNITYLPQYGATQIVRVTCDGLTDQATVILLRDGVDGSKGDKGDKGDSIKGDKGDKGDRGDNGSPGAPGRPAIVFNQDAGPANPIVGDTWYRPSYKDWYRWNGGGWERLLGNIASFDQVGAGQISVTSLGAITANIGTLISYNPAGGRVERDGNGARLYDANNVLRMRWGFW